MTPINFGIPGFFKKTGSGVAEFNENMPPITDSIQLFIDPDYAVFSDDGNALAKDGDSIRLIWDRGATGNTIEQATASHQFEYVEDHFGTGKAAIYKNTAHGPHMDFASTLSIDSATTGGITFYTVYDKTNLSTISYLFGTTDNNFNRILEYNNHSIYIQDTDGDTHYASFTNSTDLAIRAFTLDTSTDIVSTYENGVLVDSKYISKTWGTFNFDSFWGGSNTSYIGDTLLFSDIHDAAQVSQMSNWLNTKYDIYIPPISVQTNLLYHLDSQKGVYSDAGSTLATDGQAIQQINEQSSSGIIATNTESGYQATYDVNSINGLNSIRLENDNAKDTYFLSSEISLPNHEWTTHVVYKKDDLSDSAVFMADNQTLLEDGANGYTYLLHGSAYNSYDGGDDWTVASFKQDKTNSGLWYYYINGVLMTKYSSGVSATQAIDRLFQRPSKRTGEYNVADMLVYGESQSFSNIETIQNELNDKYSNIFLPIDNTLPSPPTIGSTTLDWYHNPDYNSYSDVAQTDVVDLGHVRASKITTGDLTSLIQHNATKQMQYKTTVLPNNKASFYKASNDNMKMSDDMVFTSSESFVAYSVHKRNNTGSNGIFGKDASSKNTIMDWSSDLVYFGDNGGLTSVSIPSSLDTVVRAYVIDRTAQLFRVYENGVEIDNVDITARNQSTTFDLMFNRHTYGTGQMDFGITLLYRGLHDDTNVSTVSDWLNDYYGNEIY